MNKKEKKEVCVLNYAFQRMGGKNKGRILWSLHINTVLRYGELLRDLSDVSTKMLTQSLRELETDQLIVRKTYNVVPPKVEYSLSSTGKELIPFIQYLVEWGKKQLNCELEENWWDKTFKLP